MRKKCHPHGRRRGLGPGSQPAVSSPAPGLLGGGVVFLLHPACRAVAASGRSPHPARVLGSCRVCGGRRRPQQARVTAMGGRGRRKGNGEEGGATREGGENEKKRGEHITARSYYNPAVMLIYHRRFVIRPGGDALGLYYEPAVIC